MEEQRMNGSQSCPQMWQKLEAMGEWLMFVKHTIIFLFSVRGRDEGNQNMNEI